MKYIAKHIVFSGRVQGVGFRFTAHRIASRYDLKGFVRNLPGGEVEMFAQGADKDINNCIEDIMETFAGCVRKTTVTETPPNPSYDSFKITF